MCSKCGVYHLSEIPTIKPESVSLISYVMNSSFGVKYDNLKCVNHDTRILSYTAKQVIILGKPDMFLEAAILYSDLDSGGASLLTVRVIKDGIVNPDSIGVYKFVMTKPYDLNALASVLAEVGPIMVPTFPPRNYH